MVSHFRCSIHTHSLSSITCSDDDDCVVYFSVCFAMMFTFDCCMIECVCDKI